MKMANIIDEMIDNIRTIIRSYNTSTEKIEQIQLYLKQIEGKMKMNDGFAEDQISEEG
jgi:hypothetical protein